MTQEKYIEISKTFLKELLGDVSGKPLFELWDGTIIDGDIKTTKVVIKYPWTLREMFLNPSELSMAEAYLYGDMDIIGEIYGIFPLADHLTEKNFKLSEKAKFFNLLRKLPKRDTSYEKCHAKLKGEKHSKERDAEAISYHYDVSNDFYKLFLDRNMQYSCAYFESPEEHIDVAQKRKMDYICKKLNLKPGDRLLDIGTGWGGLIIYAAKNYGVYARGITLSKNQYEFGKKWIEDEGLGDKCEIYFMDYRDVKREEKFDKIVSVGMFEHVGAKNYKKYMGIAYDILKDGGLFLNHGISVRADLYGVSRSTFSENYVFPDGELLPIYFTTQIAEETGFEVRDIECLRDHYALTLRNWVKRIEKNEDKAKEFAGDVKYRIWRLYMAGSVYQFEKGEIGVYQTLLIKKGKAGKELPLSRKLWYCK